MAASQLKRVLFGCLILTTVLNLSAHAQVCRSHSFTTNKIYLSCNDLPYLNSFLHWNYNASSSTVSIAYRHESVAASRWVAWALNPTKTGMIGSQAFVAYSLPNGTLRVHKSQVSNFNTKLEEGDLTFPVEAYSVSNSGSEITISATFVLPENKTTINQVWQEGPVSGGVLVSHTQSGDNILSKGTIDLLSGQTGSTGGTNSKTKNRNIHGVLNAVSWGIMLPVGAMIARYLKTFRSADPAWFYIHVGCQSMAYIIGVAGWATGLKLGSDSPGVEHTRHRSIGISLFVFGTLQVLALLLRPNKEHKYRPYWNYYHHGIGYGVIILSVINVFKGLDILDPEKVWRTTYLVIIIILAVVAVLLEAFTWWIVIKRKKVEHERVDGAQNGYDNRPQFTV